MTQLLAGHIAAVTGGGSGIGRAICQGYATQGARVVVLDTSAEGAAETVKLVTAAVEPLGGDWIRATGGSRQR